MEANLTKKIRDAIKQKLIELDSYVDDELPEYIMVMVANKKSKDSMEADLSLFLGKNTSNFTTWLLETLEMMEEEATSQVANGSDVSLLGKENGFSFEGEELAAGVDDDILLDTDILDDDLLTKELQDEAAILEKLLGPKKEKEVPEKKEEQISKTSFTTKQKLSQDKVYPNMSGQSLQELPVDKSKVEQYDPLNPAVKSVANLVHINERKSSVPLALQANKLLLLKAVEDANKSIVGKQNMGEIYKPTPIRVLTNPSKQNSKQQSSIPDMYGTKHANTDYIPRKRFASESQENKPVYHKMRPNLVQIIPSPDVDMSLKRTVEFSSPDDDVHMESYSSDDEGIFANSPVSPHFVVTLNGVSERTFKRKLSDELSEASDTENMCTKDSESVPAEAEPSSEKPAERCRFWPLCKNGAECTFYHPTVPCKSFPNCTFGDKCHYVHPNCKFDSLCTRQDCPYLHLSKKAIGISKAFSVPGKFAATDFPKTAVCKFSSSCTAYNCPYLHPKKCRFGSRCRSSSCPFIHPSYPSRSQLTWKSPI